MQNKYFEFTRTRSLVGLLFGAILFFGAVVAPGFLGISLTDVGSKVVPAAHAAEGQRFTIKDIQVNDLSDGSAALDLRFAGAVPPVTHFIMASPPRVIIDIPNTRNATQKKHLKLDRGTLESAVLVGNDLRLRLVLNLSKASTFNLKKIDGGYRFAVGGDYSKLSSAKAKVVQKTKQTKHTNTAAVNPAANASNNNSLANMREEPAAVASNTSGTLADVQNEASPASVAAPVAVSNNRNILADRRQDIESVDFRRTPEGRGRVIINLGSPNTIVNFSEKSGELVADFTNVKIEDKDERRIDVIDFATPVNTIDVFRQGEDVRVVISPSGQFKHTVIQNDHQYIIEVAPLTEQEITQFSEEESGYSGEPLSLNFQRIPVRAALQVIADFTGFNIITSDSVKGDLSLRLNDVPWDQALDLILQTKDLSKRQNGNVIRIAPTQEILDREKAEFEAQKDVVDLEPLVTEVIKINFAKANDLEDLIKNVKGINKTDGSVVELNNSTQLFGTNTETVVDTLLSERGSVTSDSRTNTLVVQDVPVRIRAIRRLIKQIDVPVRQVQIETRIVEATDDFSRTLGARLGFTRVTQGARLPGSSSNSSIGTVFGSASVEGNNSVRNGGLPSALSVDLAADSIGDNSASSYAYQIAKVGAGFLHLLDLEISALQADGRGKIIANPKISTTDSHPATIEQGQEVIVNGDGDAKSAVLSLTVTPQITPDNQVILDVSITNDTFADGSRTTLNTERITTQALLGNGETIVIGGIYKESQGATTVKTPLLGDIPILGNLFKKKTKFNNRTELLVFLTPRILDTDF